MPRFACTARGCVYPRVGSWPCVITTMLLRSSACGLVAWTCSQNKCNAAAIFHVWGVVNRFHRLYPAFPTPLRPLRTCLVR